MELLRILLANLTHLIVFITKRYRLRKQIIKVYVIILRSL